MEDVIHLTEFALAILDGMEPIVAYQLLDNVLIIVIMVVVAILLLEHVPVIKDSMI